MIDIYYRDMYVVLKILLIYKNTKLFVNRIRARLDVVSGNYG